MLGRHRGTPSHPTSTSQVNAKTVTAQPVPGVEQGTTRTFCMAAWGVRWAGRRDRCPGGVGRSIGQARPRVKSKMVPSEASHGASQACCRMARCRRGFPSAPAQARVQTLPLDPGTALR